MIIRVCPKCGKQNRIPPKHVADVGKCGNCKTALLPAPEPIDADTETFDAIVKEAPVPVLVDFWAEWCGPCKRAAPEVKKVAQEMAGKAVVLKVDTEAHPDLATRYEVASIPNFMVFKRGKAVMRQAGLVPSAEMRRWIEQAMSAAA